MAYSKDIKLGYFKVANLRKIYRILNWQNIVKTRTGTKFFLNMYVNVARMASNTLWRAPKVPVVKGLLVTRISNFDERIDEFCARVSNRFEIIVVRNKDYLNWRYSTVPGIKYSIYIAEDGGFVRGYIVFRYHYEGRKKMSVIYDLLTESEEISHHLLSRAESDCRKDDVDYILWSGIADKTYLRAYKNRGFVSVPFKNGQKFLVYSSDPNIPKHFLMNSSNWFIQMGDSDEL
jgi:hypothetical protein